MVLILSICPFPEKYWNEYLEEGNISLEKGFSFSPETIF